VSAIAGRLLSSSLSIRMQ